MGNFVHLSTIKKIADILPGLSPSTTWVYYDDQHWGLATVGYNIIVLPL